MTSISYRLPKAELVVSGIARTLTDELARDAQARVSTSLLDLQIDIEVSADLTTTETVTLPSGLFRSYKGSFSTLPDGRLSSASGESTGELGAVLKSVATIAGVALGAIVLGAGDNTPQDDLDLTDMMDAYKGVYPELQAELTGLRAAQKSARAKLLALLESENPNPMDVRQRRTQLAQIAEQLDPLVAHFRTWRKSKITAVDRYFRFREGVRAIPTIAPTAGEPQSINSPPTSLTTLWDGFGYGLEARWIDSNTSTGAAPDSATPRQENTIYTRRPELVELVTYRRQGEEVLVTGTSRHFVADDASPLVGYLLKKTWFAKHSLSLTFDGNGYLSGVSTEGGSEVAGALTAIAAAPDAFSGGVESATKAYASVQAAGRASLEAEAARIKAEVGRREQELLAAGQAATSSDAVELQRLNQLQSILDAQTKIRGADPSLVLALASRAGNDLDWYSRPPSPGAPEPQVIQVVLSNGSAADVPPANDTPPPALGG